MLSVVLFESLGLKRNKGLVNSLSDEIVTYMRLYENEKDAEKKGMILKAFQDSQPYVIKVSDGKIYQEPNYSKFAFYDRLLNEE